MTPCPPPVTSAASTSSVHVSIASPDADPGSINESVYHGSHVGMFPLDDDASLLGHSVPSLDRYPVPTYPVPLEICTPRPSIPHTVSQAQDDPMTQVLQGLATMFAKQDQDHIADRKSCLQFESNLKTMLSTRSSGPSMSSIASPTVLHWHLIH
jgi:hypothetical protein